MNFKSEIKNIKINREKILIVLEKKIFLYNFTDLKFLKQQDTMINTQGLCSLNMEGDTIFACLSNEEGGLNVHTDSQIQTQIKAHKTMLNCIQLTPNGNLIATSS